MQPGMGQEPMMEFGKPKKSKAPIVAGICVVLALAGVGFGVFEMMQDKGKKVEDLKIEIENSDGTKTELETDKITISDDNSTITIKDSKNGDYTIYRNLIERYIGWNYSDGDLVRGALNGDIYNPSYVAHVATGSNIASLFNADSINVTSLMNLIVKYFGKEIDLPDELRFKCGDYKKENDWSYRYIGGGCGGTHTSEPLFDISDVEEKDDSLKISIVYGTMTYGWNAPGGGLTNADGEVFEYDKDSECVTGAEEACAISVEDKKSEMEKYFYEHLDEFDKYTLTFKKENRSYILSGSSKTE